LRTSNRKVGGRQEAGGRKQTALVRRRKAAAPLPDLVERLGRAQEEVVVELVRRKAFSREDLCALFDWLRKHGLREDLQAAIGYYEPDELIPRVGFIPALANADRQIAIHAVINAGLTDEELARLGKLLDLQTDGHMLRQLRMAVELEHQRRLRHGNRGNRNRITRKRR
jgi:hypothetical protein